MFSHYLEAVYALCVQCKVRRSVSVVFVNHPCRWHRAEIFPQRRLHWRHFSCAVVGTGGKYSASDNDTGGQVAVGGVVDTGSALELQKFEIWPGVRIEIVHENKPEVKILVTLSLLRKHADEGFFWVWFGTFWWIFFNAAKLELLASATSGQFKFDFCDSFCLKVIDMALLVLSHCSAYLEWHSRVFGFDTTSSPYAKQMWNAIPLMRNQRGRIFPWCQGT